MAAGSGTVTIRILGDAKGAMKAFAETEAGSESLGGKLKNLGTGMLAVGTVVGGVAAGIGVALYDIGANFDDAYDKIRTGTGAVGGDLDVLKDEFRKVVSDVPTDFGKASDAVTVIEQKLSLAGDNAAGLAEQFLELSRITKTDLAENLQAGTDALNNWGTVTADQPRILDEMFRATQLTGITFSDLASQMSDSGLVMRGLGLTIEQSIGLLSALKTAGLDASDIMPSLTKALSTAAKEGKNAGDLLKETIDNVKSGAAGADEAAVKLFGAKGAGKFIELIKEGKLSYDDLLSTIQGGSDTIIGAGKETQDFSEKWELFKNRVLLALEPVAARVFTGMGQLMDRLPAIAERVRATFEKWKPTFDKIAAVAKAVADAFMAVMAPMLQYISDHWEQLRIALIAVAVILGGAVAASLALIVAGLAVLVVGVTAAIAVVIAVIQAFQWLWEKAEPVRKVIGDIASGLASFFVAAFNSAYVVVDALVQVFQAVWDKTSGLRDFLAGAFATGLGFVTQVFDDLRGAVDWLFSSLERVFELAGRVADAVSHIPGVNFATGGGAAAAFAPGGALAPSSGSAASNGPSISHAAAAGWHGWVNRATTFLTGEGGESEYVSITPKSQMGGGGGVGAPSGGSPVVIQIDARHSRMSAEEIFNEFARHMKNNSLPPQLKQWFNGSAA